MQRMKAAVLRDGHAIVEDVAVPEPREEEILVRVEASALNHADLAVLSGRKHGAVGGSGAVLGLECAGTVTAIGSDVTRFRPGDRVITSGSGALAQYMVVDAERAMPIPHALGFEQGACLPVALQTMHNALVTQGRLNEADDVLILGASSAVGLMGLQIAKAFGARFVAGSSTNTDRRALLSSFGADFSFDSADPEWPSRILEATGGRGASLVIDMLSGPLVNQSLRAAALQARIVNVGRLAGKTGEFDFDLHALKRIDYVGVTFRTRSVLEIREIVARTLSDVGDWLGTQRLKLPISHRYALADVNAAFEMMRSNLHFGKIVVLPP